MAEYGYDDENAKFISQYISEENRIISYNTELGQYFNGYMVDIVSKMLLAKNKSLLENKDKQLADKIREEKGTSEELKENYLKFHIVEENDTPITDMETMRKFVQNKFHFVLSDMDVENAWIMTKTEKKVLNINKKMLEFAQTSAQIEGVIAHELGHYFVEEIYKEDAKGGNINE